jgi:hypothetical protein
MCAPIVMKRLSASVVSPTLQSAVLTALCSCVYWSLMTELSSVRVISFNLSGRGKRTSRAEVTGN